MAILITSPSSNRKGKAARIPATFPLVSSQLLAARLLRRNGVVSRLTARKRSRRASKLLVRATLTEDVERVRVNPPTEGDLNQNGNLVGLPQVDLSTISGGDHPRVGDFHPDTVSVAVKHPREVSQDGAVVVRVVSTQHARDSLTALHRKTSKRTKVVARQVKGVLENQVPILVARGHHRRNKPLVNRPRVRAVTPRNKVSPRLSKLHVKRGTAVVVLSNVRRSVNVTVVVHTEQVRTSVRASSVEHSKVNTATNRARKLAGHARPHAVHVSPSELLRRGDDRRQLDRSEGLRAPRDTAKGCPRILTVLRTSTDIDLAILRLKGVPRATSLTVAHRNLAAKT